MEAQRLWLLMTELAGRLGVEVRLENLSEGEEYAVRGGICRLGGKVVAFVDRRQDPAGRSAQLGRALMAHGLEGVYLRPALREFLEGLEPSFDNGD